MAAGIRQRHRKGCNRRGSCSCSWQAEVFDAEAGEKIRKTFPSYAAANNWRHDASVALREGRLRSAGGVTLREAAEAWLAGACEGTIRTRSGDRYKPSALRSYDASLRLRILSELGERRLSELRRSHIQDVVDGLVAAGSAAATIQATIIPLKAICRREVHRGRLPVNPTAGLELPTVRGGRHRIADPTEAAALLAALSDEDRAIWATAMYAGLRRGELRALRAESIDLDANVIHVNRGWDDKEGEISTKGNNRRRVPIATVLREHLLAHLMRSGRRGDQLVFGETERTPFASRRLSKRADAAWKAARLNRITLHECRHTFASLMIAAGVNAKGLQTYMGHASIQTTFDKYGHLMPGGENEAASLLDAFLDRARGAAG
jgi:integrase